MTEKRRLKIANNQSDRALRSAVLEERIWDGRRRSSGVGFQVRQERCEHSREENEGMNVAMPILFTPPMECLLVKTLPEGPEWVYELKLDGYRAQAIGKLTVCGCFPGMAKISRSVFPLSSWRAPTRATGVDQRRTKWTIGITGQRQRTIALHCVAGAIGAEIREEQGTN